MSVALITGANGLVGSESALYFGALGFQVLGIDNNMRQVFFGPEGSTESKRSALEATLGARYQHFDVDIRDASALEAIFRTYGGSISLIIHTAAQPSHDWAAEDPGVDFSVNAVGTLNLLELTRKYAPETPFIFTSTNKVYGDRPNSLPLFEKATRWEIDPIHAFNQGIPETMSIDQTLHSVFGASKVAADIMVQEYGRYFSIPTVCFRGGCLTGPNHSGTEQHGFLAYLMKCCVSNRPYTIFGSKGKQVRDNIHSADLVAAFYEFFKAPRVGEVYNIGGGRKSNCSLLEAVAYTEMIVGNHMQLSYVDQNRSGDHIWWISDNNKFRSHFPNWDVTYDVPAILDDIFQNNVDQWTSEQPVDLEQTPAILR